MKVRNPGLADDITQIGYVVPDLKIALKQYSHFLGLEHWQILIFEPPRLHHTYVRGVETSFSMKIALCFDKSISVELIQPLRGRSVLNEFLDKGGSGLHHIALRIKDDIDDVLRYYLDQGVQVLQSGRYSVGNFDSAFYYLDTEKTLGTILELLKLNGQPPPPDETYP